MPEQTLSSDGSKYDMYLMLVLGVLSAMIYWPFAYFVWRDRVPAGLEQFEDDTRD
jgi:hypothetical protein